MASAPGKMSRIPSYIATGLLWLATAGLGLAALYYFHAIAIRIYDALGGREIRVGELIGQVAVIVGAIVWLVVIIASGEYHLKHAGEKKSWMVIAYILGVELLIIAAGMLTT